MRAAEKLPHRLPKTDEDLFDAIAYCCAECGAWVKFGTDDGPGCTVDWHKRIHGGRFKRAWRELIGR